MKSQIPNPKSQIVIVGAGPAGASLAIHLARKGFRVQLIERESFPREKLCGEFISPECLSHFKELGVLDEMLSAGGVRILETVFYSQNGKSVGVPSEWFDKNSQGALSLSRAEMDFRLMEKARESGVEVLENTSAVGLVFEDEKVCGIKIRNRKTFEVFADFIVDATGRANVLGRLAEKEISRKGAKGQRQKAKGNGQNFVGLKAHLKNASPEKNHCEIYFFRGGYGGLSFVENNLANFCFLIKAKIVKELNGNTNKIIEKIVFQNPRAFETLKNAEPVHDWLAVSVDGFGLKNLNPARNLLAVGDAGAFIDPFTGSGMLMALESAEILAKSIFENDFAPEKIAESYKFLHRRRFQRRLRVCSVMRRLAFAPSLADAAISLLSLGKRPREILARATRPGDFSAEER